MQPAVCGGKESKDTGRWTPGEANGTGGTEDFDCLDKETIISCEIH